MSGTPGSANAAVAMSPGCTRGSAKATMSNPIEFHNADAARAIPANSAVLRKSIHNDSHLTPERLGRGYRHNIRIDCW